MLQNCEMQGCQWYGVKRIISYFCEEKLRKKIEDRSLLSQAVLISSIKPISSSISLSGGPNRAAGYLGGGALGHSPPLGRQDSIISIE